MNPISVLLQQQIVAGYKKKKKKVGVTCIFAFVNELFYRVTIQNGSMFVLGFFVLRAALTTELFALQKKKKTYDRGDLSDFILCAYTPGFSWLNRLLNLKTEYTEFGANHVSPR